MIDIKSEFHYPDPTEVYTDHQLRTLRERIGTNEKGSENLSLALEEIRRLCEAVGLSPELSSKACETYQDIIQTDIVNNNSMSMLAAGVVYLICQKERVPRRLKHIAAASSVPTRQEGTDESWGDSYYGGKEAVIGRAYRTVASTLQETNTPIPAQKFIDWYCSELDVDQSVQQQAFKIVDKTEENAQTSGKPSAAAAGAVYFASTLVEEAELTQKDVEAVSLVNVRTIRERYREQMEWYTDNMGNFDIKSQPYVGNAPWMKPMDDQVLSDIGDDVRGPTVICYNSSHYWGSNFDREKPLYEYGLTDIGRVWPAINTTIRYRSQRRSLVYHAEFEISDLGKVYLAGDLDPNALCKTRIWPGYSKISKFVDKHEYPTWSELNGIGGFSYGLISSARNKGYIAKARGGYEIGSEYQDVL